MPPWKPSSPGCSHLAEAVSAWLSEMKARYLSAAGSDILVAAADGAARLWRKPQVPQISGLGARSKALPTA